MRTMAIFISRLYRSAKVSRTIHDARERRTQITHDAALNEIMAGYRYSGLKHENPSIEGDSGHPRRFPPKNTDCQGCQNDGCQSGCDRSRGNYAATVRTQVRTENGNKYLTV